MSDQSPVLSFSASLISNNRDDQLRDFVIIYTLNDQSFAVMEKVVPNSGFPGGRFLQKMQTVNPETGYPYEPSELKIGTDLTLCGWRFHIYAASEGTLNTMEALADTFQESNLNEIMLRIRSELKPKISDFKTKITRMDKQKRGKIPKDDLFNALDEFGITVSPQEEITIFRRYQFADSSLFEYGDFIQFLE